MFKPLAELVGTFIFISVIFFVVNKKIIIAPMIIGFVLTGLILLIGNISGGHLNPAVSLMFYLNQSITLNEFILYIVAQSIGAILAFILIRNFL